MEPAAAIVVLGCRVMPDGHLSRSLARRVAVALAAYHDKRAPRLIVSGGRSWHGVSEAEAMARALEAGGVVPERITLELCSLSTRENAAFTRALLPADARVLVATSSSHMQRALANFEAVGLRAEPLEAPDESFEPGVRGAAIRAYRILCEAIRARRDRSRFSRASSLLERAAWMTLRASDGGR